MKSQNDFSFLRIEKENINTLKRHKSVNRFCLGTTRYNIVWFYKPITKMFDIIEK
jgi:hypothetical protein